MFHRDDKSETSDSSSSLEIPYAMDLSISDHVDPIDNDDDDKSESTGCGSYTSPTRRQREPLRAGDVIRYTNPAFTARHAQGSRVAQILSVDPEARDFPLVLDNCELLPTDTFIRRVGELYKGQLRPHKGRSKVLSSFVLKKTRGCTNQDALQKQMLLRAGTFKDALKQMETDAMKIYRTGSVPKKKHTTTTTTATTQPQMGIFPAAILANSRRRHSKSSSSIRYSKTADGVSSRTTNETPTETGPAPESTVRRSKVLSTSSLLDSPVKPAGVKTTAPTRSSFEKRKNRLKTTPPPTTTATTTRKKKRSLLDIALHPSSTDDSTSSEEEVVMTTFKSSSMPTVVRKQSPSTTRLVAKQKKTSPSPSEPRETGFQTMAGSESVHSRYDRTGRRNNGAIATSSSSNLTNWRSKDTTRGTISKAKDAKASTLDTTSASFQKNNQQRPSSILDRKESDDDMDDDDDNDNEEKVLWTQNVPLYTEYRPKIPPAHRNATMVITRRRTTTSSSLSFSKQNNKTPTTLVSSKDTNVPNPVPGTAHTLVMTPAASRPLTWNSTKSPLQVSSMPKYTTESPLSHEAVTTVRKKKECSKITSVSAPNVSDDIMKHAVLGLLPGFSDVGSEGRSKLAKTKAKTGVPNAPRNWTTFDDGLEDNQSSEESISGGMVRTTRAGSSSSSSDDEKFKKHTRSSNRMATSFCHDATPVLEDAVGKDDTCLRKPGPKKRDSDILWAKPPASTKSPTTMDGVTRRYQDLIASDSDDNNVETTGRNFRNVRVEMTGKEDSQKVVIDGGNTLDSSGTGGPARYFLPDAPPMTIGTTTSSAHKARNGSGESKYAKRKAKPFHILNVKSVLETTTPLPRSEETPKPSKSMGNLPLFSSDDSSPTPLKSGKLRSNARKRKARYDSVSDDTRSQPIRRLSTAKDDIPSSWSTDCEVDSPPSSPPRDHLRRLSSFRSKQDTKRCRGSEPKPFIASPVFDFGDETSPDRNRKVFGNKAGPPKKIIRVL